LDTSPTIAQKLVGNVIKLRKKREGWRGDERERGGEGVKEATKLYRISV
jgi:hypothetical protein